MRWERSPSGMTIALLCGLSASPSEATPTFPQTLQAAVNLSSTPSCGLCHIGGVGGLNTANTPFARAMRDRGLQPFDENTCRQAALALRAEGNPLMQALIAGQDPNANSGPTPTFGCGGNVAQGRPTGLWWLLAFAWIPARYLFRMHRRSRSA